MAREIDERIVKMQLENGQFERNAKESLGTLDKLQKGLDFSGAARGLADLSRESCGFSLDGIGSAVESISSSFSALGVIGITALQNITNKAIDTGTALVKSLSVDNIAAGWSKLEQKTTSVATLVAQGYDMSTVERQLERLNWFTDETSYNFTDMTSNIAKFTATGKGLSESVTAMEGIANWAALSGQNAATASRAMYQISQAMGAGVMRLEDWRSIQNASMDTDEFRQKALDAAVALGTLRKNADGTYASLANQSEAFSKSQFASHLTEGAWFTSDVMMQVFNDYSAAVDQIYTYAEKKGITASQAIEEIGDSIDEFALKAFKAAQEAKTWSDAVDSVKDAVSTGWMNTFEAIFGNYEEQRVLWTDLANSMYDVFAAGGNARNAILHEALDSGWTKFLKEGISDAEAYRDVVISTARDHGIAVDDTIEASGSFSESLQEGWLSADILSESLTKLADKTRGLSDEELKALGYTRAEIDELEKLEKAVKSGTVDVNEYANAISELSGRQVLVQAFWNAWEAVGSVVTPIKEAFRELFPPKTAEDVRRFTERLREFTKSLVLSEEVTQKVKTVASGLFGTLKFGLGIIKNAFGIASKLLSKLSPFKDIAVDLLVTLGSVFSSLGQYTKISDEFSSVLDTILDAIGHIAESAYNSYIWLKEFIGQFKQKISLPGAEKTATVLETLYGIICKILSPLKTVKNYLVELFSNLDFSKLVLSGEQAGNFFTAKFSEIREGTKGLFSGIDWGKALQGGLFVALGGAIWKFIKKLKDSKSVFGDFLSDLKDIAGGISDALSAVKDTLTAYQNSINAKTILNIAIAIGVLAASLIAMSFVDGEKLGTGLTGLSVVLGEVIGAMKILQGMNPKGMKSAAASIAMFSVGILIFSAALAKLAVFDSFEKLVPALVAITSSVALLTSSAIVFSKAVDEKSLKKAASSLITLAISFAAIGGALYLYKGLEWDTVLLGMGAFGIALAEMAAFSRLVDGKSLKSSSSALLSLSISLAVISVAIKTLGNVPLENLKKGLGAVAATLAAVAVSVKVMGASDHLLGVSAAMLSIATALTIMMVPVLTLGNMDTEKLKSGLIAVGALLVGVTASAAILGAVGKNIGGLLAATLAVMAIAAALTVLVIPISILGNLPLSTVAQGLGTLLIALAAFAVVSVILAPLGVALIAVAAAFALFGASVLAIGAGLTLIAAGFTALAVAGVAGATALIAAIASIVAGLLAMIPQITLLLGSAVIAVCEAIVIATPTIALAVTTLLLALLQVIRDVGPDFIETVVFLLDELLRILAEHVPSFVQSAIDLIVGVLEGIADGIPDIIAAGVDIVLALLEGIGDAIPDIVDGAFQLIEDFFDGLMNAMDEHGEKVFDAIGDFAGSMITNLVKGIWAGLQSVVDAVVGLARDAWDAAKNWLGIASPAKKTEYIGEMFDAGMAKGIRGSSRDVSDEAEDVGKKAITRLQQSISKLRDTSAGMEFSPSITPVLDLSDVKSKASHIGSILSENARIAVGSIRDNVGAAALSMKSDPVGSPEKGTVGSEQTMALYFTQNNYSPEPLNRIDIYRQTKNQFSSLKELITA